MITTLDWRAQKLAEKWLAAAAIAPNLKREAGDRAAAEPEDRRRRTGGWINALRGKDLHNGALVALDYRTGDVLAYAGSAGYYQDDLASRKFEPKYDAAGDGDAPARLGLEADRLRERVRHQQAHAGQPPPRHRDASSTAARTGRRATPTSSSADRSSSARPSSTR